MNTKISDEEVSIACGAWLNESAKMRGGDHDCMRAAPQEFLHRRHPQPAELAEQQGLNDQFEAWAKTKRLNLSCYMDMAIGYCDERTKTAWAAWQAALAVTGKQQVGEVPTGDIRFDGRPRYPEQSAIGKLYTVADAIQPSAAQHEQVRRRLILEAVDMLIAAVPEQVSEVQGSND